jgi:hypothetical protein
VSERFGAAFVGTVMCRLGNGLRMRWDRLRQSNCWAMLGRSTPCLWGQRIRACLDGSHDALDSMMGLGSERGVTVCGCGSELVVGTRLRGDAW